MVRTIPARLPLAAALIALGCAGDPSGGTTADPATAASDLATVADGVTTASDLASAPELAGMLLGLARPPSIPDGIEGFRCDAKPQITITQVCGLPFPSKIELSWSSCDAHPPLERFHRGLPGDGGVADRLTSTGTVSITNSITTDPPDACVRTSTFTFSRSTTFDVKTTAADGSREISGTVATTSVRDPSARTFTTTETHDVTTTDEDASGAVTKSRHLSGTLTVAFAAGAGLPTRTIDGTLTDVSDGATATVTITDLVRGAPLDCRWPTSGTIKSTRADGTSHTLVFGPTCGAATLDGVAVTLPTSTFGHPSR